MKSKYLKPVKLVLCGPSDVAVETKMAKSVVDNWNQLNAEARGLWIKHQHWQTDVYPDLADRTQEVPNSQIIDPAKILVAVFWWRFGTPTGTAASGTQEEILRAIDQRKKVMIYFSDLEPKPKHADSRQMDLLWEFRQETRRKGIAFSFNSRAEFQKLFTSHLALAMNAFAPGVRSPRKRGASVEQNARTGKGDIHQYVDNRSYQRPPAENVVRERRPGSVTSEEEHQIVQWIKDLAEGEVTMERSDAYGMWGGRFKNHFKLGHREDLPSPKMPDAEAWYRQQKAIQKRGYKTKAPDAFRFERIKSIKAAMAQIEKAKEAYYPELSSRLKMRKPFSSLKDLTKRNLDRVYNLVRSDLRNRSGS